MRETGVDWQDRLQSGEEDVPFEVELRFRADAKRREPQFRSIIASLDGEVIQQCAFLTSLTIAILGRNPEHKSRIS